MRTLDLSIKLNCSLCLKFWQRKREREGMSLFGNEHPLKGQYVTFHLPTPHCCVKGLQAECSETLELRAWRWVVVMIC